MCGVCSALVPLICTKEVVEAGEEEEEIYRSNRQLSEYQKKKKNEAERENKITLQLEVNPIASFDAHDAIYNFHKNSLSTIKIFLHIAFNSFKLNFLIKKKQYLQTCEFSSQMKLQSTTIIEDDNK